MVALPREVPDLEAPREGALLQAEQARVGDLVEGARVLRQPSGQQSGRTEEQSQCC